MAVDNKSAAGLAPEILADFRRGDREAFLAVYAAHALHLRPLVYAFFRSPFEREEALQEVWLQAHRACNAFDPTRGELLPWLRTVAANRCKELLRARGRRPDARDPIDDAQLVDLRDPESVARADRVRDAVARFAAALDPEQGAVFRLSLVEERSHDEVAATLGVAARRVKYLRMNLLLQVAACRDLRVALGEAGEP